MHTPLCTQDSDSGKIMVLIVKYFDDYILMSWLLVSAGANGWVSVC